MRLLVPTRIYLALRWATTPPASRAVTRAPKQNSMSVAAARLETKTRRTTEKEKEASLRREALTNLDAGKNEEFRAQWKGKLLSDEMSDIVTLHEALLRSAERGKPDQAMLRWYAESLVDEQRTPYPAKPHFESMMVPVVRALGGKIEKWEEDDKRKEKLRKWRADFDYKDEALENLLDSMLDYMTYLTEQKRFTPFNLLLLEKALERVKRQERTVAVNWSDIVYRGAASSMNFDNLLPGYSLVQVAREADTKNLKFRQLEFLRTAQSSKHPFMKEPSEVEGTWRFDGFCTLMFAVAARGHWLSNGNVKKYTERFKLYGEKYSGDVSQGNLLKNFAYDSVLRYSSSGIVQPAVDHSRAPQFIDQEKKELAFTVAHDLEGKHPYKSVEYYSLHLD